MNFVRGRELLLLAFPIALVLLALVQLGLARSGQVALGQAESWLVLVAALLPVHAFLSWRHRGSDQVLLPLTAMLAGLGVVAISRLQPDLAARQSTWLAVGLTLTVGVLHWLPSVDWLKQYKYTWAILGLTVVLATFLFGVDPNGSGARLWLGLGGLLFQPSEVLKVLVVVFFAAYLDDYRELIAFGGRPIGALQLPPVPYLTPLFAMLGVSLAVLVWQRDLGAAMLFYCVFLCLLFAASGRIGTVLIGFAGFLAAAYAAHLLFAHVQLRVAVWLDPWSQAQTGGYQAIQALMALAAGGVAGTGLGYGSAGIIPAAHTDFVIAEIGEEMGLIGSLAVVCLYAALVHRAFRIALQTGNSFAALLAAGVGSVIGMQALIILGGTLRLIPLTGMTLPLISYGGSSVVANCVMLGLLLRISDEAEQVAGAE